MASAAEKMADKRQRMRSEGFRPLEVWLPGDLVERVDALKSRLGVESRNEVFLHLIGGSADVTATPSAEDTLLTQ